MAQAQALIETKVSSNAGDITLQTFTSDELWASIGAERDQKAFKQRALALSDPKAYEAERSTALDKLKKAAGVSFKSTYTMYNAAGFGASESKKLAIAAAKQSYNIGMKALHASFPSATDNIYRTASTTGGVMLAKASRSAPRKKKAASKRR